jgi:hypothetical protein
MSQVPDIKNAVFPPNIRRQGRDEYITVTQKERSWTHSLHRDHPTFSTIMTHLRSWARMSDSSIVTTTMSPRQEQVTGGVNLLSVGKYDVTLISTHMLINC